MSGLFQKQNIKLIIVSILFLFGFVHEYHSYEFGDFYGTPEQGKMEMLKTQLEATAENAYRMAEASFYTEENKEKIARRPENSSIVDPPPFSMSTDQINDSLKHGSKNPFSVKYKIRSFVFFQHRNYYGVIDMFTVRSLVVFKTQYLCDQTADYLNRSWSKMDFFAYKNEADCENKILESNIKYVLGGAKGGIGILDWLQKID